MGWLTLYVFLVTEQTEQTPRLVMSIIATSLAFTVFNLLQLHRNDVEDRMRISGSRHHLAPGLALPFFQVIEGIIKGNPGRSDKLIYLTVQLYT